MIGLLVPRPCGEKAKGRCKKCDRAVCAAHGVVKDAGLLCPHCAEGKRPPAVVMDVPSDLAFEPKDLETFRTEKIELAGNAWSDLT